MTRREGHVIEQFVYGKLVTSPGGPIVAGSEHRCTGRSVDFPRELEPFCHPSRVGLGDRDARRWSQCGWRDEGGIVSLGTDTPAGPWVLAARLRERSEEGEGVEGRLYAQAHYAAMPAREYRWDTLLRAAPLLQAIPREHYDMSLPPLELPDTTRDEDLPADWLERVTIYLRGVLSGVPVNVQEWVLKPDVFLQQMTWALAAVPATLRWRLPIGAGMLTMERATAMAYGMAALGGLRVIGGVPRNADEVDLSRGDCYLEWLSSVAGTCGTTGEVAARVASELPKLDRVDAIDPGVVWVDAARQVADISGEKRLLVQVRQGGRVDDVAAVQYLRPELLGELSQRVVGGESAGALAELARTLGGGWDESWQTALARAEGGERERLEQVAMLLGLRPVTDPARLAELVDLDIGDAREAVAARMQRASDAAGEAAPWLPLLQAAAVAAGTGASTWATTWRELAAPRLAWIAIRDALAGRPGAQVLAVLPDRSIVVTARALVRGLPVQEHDLSELLGAARDQDGVTVDALVARMLEHNPWLGYRLAELAHVRGMPTALERGHDERGAPIVRDAVRESLACVIGDGHHVVGPFMLRDLLHWTGLHGNGVRATRLRGALALMIGDPYATALLGEAPAGREGQLAAVAEAHALRDLVISDEIAERLLLQLKEFPGRTEERVVALLKRWLATTPEPSARERRWPLARTVRGFADESSLSTVSIAPAHHELVKRALLTLRISSVRVAQVAHDESTLRLAVDYWNDPSGMMLNSDQLLALLLATVDDGAERTWWTACISEKGWSGAPGWRWIMRTARDVTETERKAIVRLDGNAVTTLVLFALPVPREASLRIRRDEIDYLLKHVPRGTAVGVPPGLGLVEIVRRLLHFGELANDRELLAELGRAAVRVARDEGHDKRGLRTALVGEGGLSKLMHVFGREPQTAVELIRRIARRLDVAVDSMVERWWEETRRR